MTFSPGALHTYSSEGDIFAADIYYHTKSIYLNRYHKYVETVLNRIECEDEHNVRSKEHASAFDQILHFSSDFDKTFRISFLHISDSGGFTSFSISDFSLMFIGTTPSFLIPKLPK